jgi:DNA-binding transcriptional MerR regulator
VRIRELSDRGGVAVPTVKYYLREGLLPAGARTSPNQAHYTDDHVRRLRLIRALIEVGGLSIAAVRDVLEALDRRDESVHDVLGQVQQLITEAPGYRNDQDAERQIAEFLTRRGYECDLDDPAARSLVAVLATAQRLGHSRFIDQLDAYGDACDRIADADLSYIMHSDSIDDLVESMVVGTVLGDVALVALRRIAHKAASLTRESAGHPGRSHP